MSTVEGRWQRHVSFKASLAICVWCILFLNAVLASVFALVWQIADIIKGMNTFSDEITFWMARAALGWIIWIAFHWWLITPPKGE